MIAIPASLEEWTVENIRALLAAHVYENARLDWKEDLPTSGGGERFVSCAVAMANRGGGFVVIGVADSREHAPARRLVGVDAGRDLTQQIGELLKSADPAIPHSVQNPPLTLPASPGRVIAVLEIKGGTGPHSHRGTFYGRDGSNVRPLTTAEVQDLFIRREEMMTKVRLLIVELVSAREAALGINLVTAERKTSFLRSIDTRVIAELHAGILPFLRDDEDLSTQLTTLRGQADVLNFRVENVLPRFYQPKMIQKYADPNFDVFVESGLHSDSYTYAGRVARVIVRLCEKAKLPTPKLLEGHEIRDRGAF